jgi:hypothetical protein
VGFGCGRVKLNVVFLCRQEGWQNTSFNFAEALAFLIFCQSIYWSACLFTMTANGLRLGEGGDFHHKC